MTYSVEGKQPMYSNGAPLSAGPNTYTELAYSPFFFFYTTGFGGRHHIRHQPHNQNGQGAGGVKVVGGGGRSLSQKYERSQNTSTVVHDEGFETMTCNAALFAITHAFRVTRTLRHMSSLRTAKGWNVLARTAIRTAAGTTVPPTPPTDTHTSGHEADWHHRNSRSKKVSIN